MPNQIIWTSLNDLLLRLTTTITKWTTQWNCLTCHLLDTRSTIRTLDIMELRHQPLTLSNLVRQHRKIEYQTRRTTVEMLINPLTWAIVMHLEAIRRSVIWILASWINRNGQTARVITKAQLLKNRPLITTKEALKSKVLQRRDKATVTHLSKHHRAMQSLPMLMVLVHRCSLICTALVPVKLLLRQTMQLRQH